MAMRLAVRALVALLIAAAVFAGVGAAVAAGEGPDGLPTSIVVAPSRLGDRATYRATVTGDWNIGAEGIVDEALTFAWGPGAPLRDLTGDVVATDRADVMGRTWNWGVAQNGMTLEGWKLYANDQAILYASGSTRPVAQVGGGNGTYEGGGNASIAGVPILTQGSAIAMDTRSVFVGPASATADCLFAHDLHGQELSIGDQVVVADDSCSLLGLASWGRASRPGGAVQLNATVTRAERIGGHPALRLEAVAANVSSPWTDADADHLWIWFAEGVAYPLALEAVFGEVAVRYDLVGLEAGAAERTAQPNVGAVPLVEVDRPAWTLDDAGVPSAWPLSQAYKTAASDPTSPLPAFLADHPNAYVSLARPDFDGRWVMVVTGDDTALSFTMDRAEAVCLPVAPCDLQSRYTYSDAVTDRRTAPAPAEVQQRTPTLASLVAAMQSYATRPLSSDLVSWDFEVDCDFFIQALEGRCAPSLVFDLEQKVDEATEPTVRPGVPPTVEQGRQSKTMSLSNWFGTGQLLFTEYDVTWDTTSQVAATATPSATYGQPAEEDEPSTLAAIVVPRSPIVAGGAGLLAVFVGLVYLLWPSLKGALLGLFSRQAPGRALEHPQRARILQLVEAQPGIHHNELRRILELGNGTVSHHIAVLVRDGHLHKVPGAGYTCYYPGRARAAMAHAAPALKSDGARRVLAAIQQAPGSSNLDVAQRTGLDPGTVHHHVRRLVDAGLVQATREGRSLSLRPAAGAAA